VLLIDQRGRQRIGFPVDQLTPEGLAHDIRRLESER
jgi:protein SCO1/2